MTSVLNVDTIADKAGTGPVALTKQSAAKAWVSFQNRSSNSTLDSFNSSSVTDNGTGDFTVTKSNAFNTINYTHATGSGVISSAGTYTAMTGLRNDSSLSNVVTTTTARYVSLGHDGTASDCANNTVTNFGDLA